MKFFEKNTCEICGKTFPLDKEYVYQIKKELPVLASLTEPAQIYDAIDCPFCGCQKILNKRYECIKITNYCEVENNE